MKKNKKKDDLVVCSSCGASLSITEKSLRESRCLSCATFNKFIEQMIEQVIITDKRGNIICVNKAVEKTTGFALHEIIGKKPSELWGDQMSKQFYKNMWQVMEKKKESVTLRMTNKRKNGELYEIDLIVSPILDINKEIIFFIGIEVVVNEKDRVVK